MAYDEIKRLLASVNGDQRIMPGIDPEDEIEREIYADAPEQTVDEPLLMPKAPQYPKIELQSPGAKQYQDIVSNQMNYFDQKQQKADSDYDSLLEKRTSIKKPSTDSFDQIMGAMVPLAVAALGGEAGKISQPGAFKSYQGYLEKDEEKKRKDYQQQLKDNELNLKSAERKSTAYQNKQSNLMTDSAWKTAQMEQAEAKDDKDFEQQIAMAKLQASLRPKGAAIGTFEKAALANLGKKVSNMYSSVANFKQLQMLINKPDMDDNLKVQAALDMLKQYNSPENPDAVGKEEVLRLTPFLQKLPNPLGPKGMKIGYDMPKFKAQLENSISRIEGVIKSDLETAKFIQDGPSGQYAPMPPKPQQAPPSTKEKPKSFKRKDGSVVNLQPDGTYK